MYVDIIFLQRSLHFQIYMVSYKKILITFEYVLKMIQVYSVNKAFMYITYPQILTLSLESASEFQN